MIVYISGGRHCSCENEAPTSRFPRKFSRGPAPSRLFKWPILDQSATSRDSAPYILSLAHGQLWNLPWAISDGLNMLIIYNWYQFPGLSLHNYNSYNSSPIDGQTIILLFHGRSSKGDKTTWCSWIQFFLLFLHNCWSSLKSSKEKWFYGTVRLKTENWKLLKKTKNESYLKQPKSI